MILKRTSLRHLTQLRIQVMWQCAVDRCQPEEVNDARHLEAVLPTGNPIHAIKAQSPGYVLLVKAGLLSLEPKFVG